MHAIIMQTKSNSNKFSCGIHFFKVLVQIHYSMNTMNTHNLLLRNALCSNYNPNKALALFGLTAYIMFSMLCFTQCFIDIYFWDL